MALGELTLSITADANDAIAALEAVGNVASEVPSVHNIDIQTSGDDDATSGLSGVAEAAQGVDTSSADAGSGLGSLAGSMGGATKAAGGLTTGAGGAAAALGPLAIGGAAVGGAIIGLAALGAGIVAVTAKMIDIADEASNTGDELHKMSIRVGQTSEDLQRLDHAAELSDASLEDIERASRRTDVALMDLADDVAGATSHTEAMSVASDELGDRLAQQLLPMLLEGSDGIEAMASELDDLGGVMDGDTIAAAVAWQDNLSRIDRLTDNITHRIAKMFLPIMVEVSEVFIEVGKVMRQVVPATDGLDRSLQGLTRGGLVLTVKGFEQVFRIIKPTSLALVSFSDHIAKAGNLMVNSVQTARVFREAVVMIGASFVRVTADALMPFMETLDRFAKMAADASDSRLIPNRVHEDMLALSQATGTATDRVADLQGTFDDMSSDAMKGLVAEALKLGVTADGFSAEDVEDFFSALSQGAGLAREQMAALAAAIEAGEFKFDPDDVSGLGDFFEDLGDDDDDSEFELGISDESLEVLKARRRILEEEDELRRVALEKELEAIKLAERHAEIREQGLDTEREAEKLRIASAESAQRMAELDQRRVQIEEELRGLSEDEIALREAQNALITEEDHLRRLILEKRITQMETEQAIADLEAQGLEGAALRLEIDRLRAEEQAKIRDLQSEISSIQDGQGRSLEEVTSQLQSHVRLWGDIADGIFGAAGASDTLSDVLSEVENTVSDIAAGFAAGGPIGGAIAGVASGVSSLVSLLNDDDDDDDQENKLVRDERDDRDLAKMIAKELVDEQEKRLGKPVVVNVDARGNLVGEQNEVSRTLADLIESDMVRRHRGGGGNG